MIAINRILTMFLVCCIHLVNSAQNSVIATASAYAGSRSDGSVGAITQANVQTKGGGRGTAKATAEVDLGNCKIRLTSRAKLSVRRNLKPIVKKTCGDAIALAFSLAFASGEFETVTEAEAWIEEKCDEWGQQESEAFSIAAAQVFRCR
eukprot:TRINITY_DN4111_c0_g1_i1.p2 TRINITY_DN4111_c0_g1~~TRINITY_DN4111_c0_g1_i1.p2  ORF type:complete len:149 (-),score=28.30 TRINITY_DN4111_c0_g1_i1:336-782(-)